MKAAVCYAFDRPLVVEEVEIDPPQPGEVKIRLAATAICHSDVHLIRGEWGGDLPVVAGHEVDVPRLVDLYRHGRLKLDELISARYPLEQINEAIAAMETGEVLRNVIVFDQSS